MTQAYFDWIREQNDPRIELRDLEDGTYLMAKPLLFHWTLIRGVVGDMINEYFDRWCYYTEEQAKQALRDFPDDPPFGYEPEGWHRHPTSGRRRPNGDATREYVDP